MDKGRKVLGLIKNAYITEEREFQGIKFRKLHITFINKTGAVLDSEFKIKATEVTTLQMMLDMDELAK